MTFSQFWSYYKTYTKETGTLLANYKDPMNMVFTNHNKEDLVYPLTPRHIATSHSNEKKQGNKPNRMVIS